MEAVDPDLIASARLLVNPGDSVWDIGANCGLFAFSAAYLAGTSGHILAVEPDTFLASLLKRSNDHNQPDTAHVSVLACAVSDVIDATNLNIASRGRSSNSLAQGRSQTGGFRTAQPTVVVTLDWLAEQYSAPDIIKIDVEGLEAQVLRGGMETIAHHQPTLYVEVGGGQQNDVSDLLSRLGYRMYDPANPTVPIDHPTYNTIARHPDKEG